MPFAQGDASQIRRVLLPPVWNLFKKEASLHYCQMASDSTEENCRATIVQTFADNAYRISLAFGGNRTAIAVKKPKEDLFENVDFLLQTSAFDRDGEILSFPPRAEWIKHPNLLSHVGSPLCDLVRKSWDSGITYLQ